MYFSAQWFESSCCGGSASFIWQLFWKNGVRHLISFNYARVPTLHVWVRWEFEEDTDLFVLDGRVSKKLGMVPCGCVRMKVSPLGPEFSYLAIRRHTHTWQSDVTPVRSRTSAWTAGCSISAVVEDKLSCLTCGWTQMTVASWIWTWTFNILSQSTVDQPRENRQTFFHAFWSRQNMTKHPSNSKCFQIVQPFVPKCSCFVLPCPV